METQKILKSKETVVVCDYRECEVIEQLKRIGAKVNEQALTVGDFVVSDRVSIERKTHSDFIGSVINGRVFEQAKNLKENFAKPIIVIEGSSNRQINENALKAAIASLLIDFGVSMLATKNPQDTARAIYWIAKKEQGDGGREIVIKVGKKPKEVKRLQEFIVCGIPGVSTITARKLLNHFGTVENLFVASEEELKKVKGIGKKLAEKIRKVLTAKY